MTKHIIERHLNAIDSQKEELRRDFLTELDRLGNDAKSATQITIGSLPTLAFLETHLERLRELREKFERAECERDLLRRVSEATEFEASRNAG